MDLGGDCLDFWGELLGCVLLFLDCCGFGCGIYCWCGIIGWLVGGGVLEC